MRLSADEIKKQVHNNTYKGINYEKINKKRSSIEEHWSDEIKEGAKNPKEYHLNKTKDDAENQYKSASKSKTASSATRSYYKNRLENAEKKLQNYNLDKAEANYYAAKNSTDLSDEKKDEYYDEYKKLLKEQKNDKRSEYFKSWLSYQGSKLYGDEDSAERQYETAKKEYKSAKNNYQRVREDKYNTQQAENEKVLQSNEKAAELTAQAYESKIIMDGFNKSNSQPSLANYDDSYVSAEIEVYDNAVKGLEKMGLDAESLIDTYTRQQNKEFTQQLNEQSQKFADEHPVLSRGAYVAAQTGTIEAVPDIVTSGIENAVSGEYKPLDTNSSTYAAVNFRNSVSEKNTENLYNYALEKTGSKTTANIVTLLDSTGLSVADMLSISYMPQPVTLAVMGCSSAASTAVDATNRGLSADQALYTATAAGAAEIFFEKIGLENFRAFQTSGRKGVLNAVKDFAKQTFTEGSEEAFTDIANAITDQIINGDSSAISQKYQNYIASGMTKEEAKKKVAEEFGRQVGESFTGGALAGAALGGVGVAARKGIYNKQNYKSYGESIKDGKSAAEDVQAVIDSGLASQDKNSRAYKLASELQESVNKQIKNGTANSDNDVDVLTGASVKTNAYNYKNIDSAKLGELAIDNQRQVIRENISSAVSEEKNADEINKVIKKISSAQTITKKDAKVISGSKAAVSALNAELKTNFTGSDITADVLGDIATGLAYGETDFSYIKTKPQQSSANTDLTGRASNVSTVKKGQTKIKIMSDQVPTKIYSIPVKSVATGSTGYISSSKPITVRGSEVTLNTPIGEVDYADVDIPDSDTKVIFDYVAENDKIGDTGANTIYRNFNSRMKNVTAEEYVQQAGLIYEAGLANDTDFSTYIAMHPQFKNSARVLGDGAERIYRSAQTDRHAFDEAQQAEKEKQSEKRKEKQKKATRSGKGTYKNETAAGSDIETVLKTLADVTGYDYVTTSDTNSNGHIIHNMAQVFISNETGKEYQSVIHENLHYIKEHNAEGYENLRTAILEWYKESEGNERFNTVRKNYTEAYTADGKPYTTADIDEELVADGIAAIFTTDEGVEQFAEYVAEKSEPEKKSIVQAFKDLVNRIIEAIKTALSRGSLTAYQKEYLKMEQKQAEKIRTQFLSALDTAAENYKSEQKNNATDSGEVTHIAFSKDIENNAVSELLDVMSNNYELIKGSDKIYNIDKDVVENKSAKISENILEYFNSIGNIAYNSELGNVELVRSGAKTTVTKGYSSKKASAVGAIKDVIEKGIIIDRQKKWKGRGYDTVVIAGRGTLYGEDSIMGVVVKTYPDNKGQNAKFYLHEIIEIKEADLYKQTAPQLSVDAEHKSTSDSSISNSDENVNTKNSLTVDSDGNSLSKQQQEYFKDSKVRDENGRLLVVYHGTPNANFTKFRSGSYFSQNKEYADRYQSPGASSISVKTNSDNPDTYKVYLNIKKPFDTRNKKERKIFENEFYMKWGNGSPLSERGLPDWLEGMDLQEFIEENEYDYDGLIVDEGGEGGYGMPVYDRGLGYVTFNANQIKNVNNVNPTENEDIRYSVDVDEFDEAEYNYPKLSGREYGRLRSEIITNYPNVKNTVNCIRLASTNSTYYYILDDDYSLTILNKSPLGNIHKEKENANRTSVETGRQIRRVRSGRGDSQRDISGIEGTGAAGGNVRLSGADLQQEGQSNRRGNAENGNNADVREEGEKSSIDVDTDVKKLRRENKKLKEANELLKKEFELTGGVGEVYTSSAVNIARHIKKEYGFTMPGTELGKEIKEMVDRIMQDENRSYDDLYSSAHAIAKKAVDSIKNEISPESKEFLDDVRSTAVKLSEKQKQEVAYHYGSYSAFRRANMGRLKISDDGILLDIRYQELAETYPQYITDTTEPDEPLELAELIEYLKNGVENDYGYDADELTDMVTEDIIEAYYNVSVRHTFADKKQKEINILSSKYSKALLKNTELKEENQKEINLIRSKYRETIKEIKKRDSEKYSEALKKNADLKKDIRNLKEEHRRALIDTRRETRKDMVETRERSKARESIQRQLLKLSTLTKQTKKQHIPNNMIEAVRDLINAVSFDTRTDVVLAEKIRNLDDGFRMLESKEDSHYAIITDMYNGLIKDELEDLRETLSSKVVRDMTSDELKRIERLIRMTLSSINNINEMYGYERKKSVEASADKVSEEISEYSKGKVFGGKSYNSLKYGSMKPEYFFEYLGSDELLKRYKDVRKGEDAWAVTVSEAKKYADDIRNKYKRKSWDFKKKVKIKTTVGEELEFNLGQIMSIYAMSRREQAKGHLLGGGFVFSMRSQTTLEFVKNKGYQIIDNKAHLISDADLKKIISQLTTEQKEYVVDMTDYLSGQMAEKGNEVSRELYDVELYKEDNYFPIQTAKNYRQALELKASGKHKVENPAFSKPTVKDAANPLMLQDFDDVWAEHVDGVAKYNAFAIPLQNLDRVFNYQTHDGRSYTSVRVQIENAYGKNATKYIDDFLNDLNGGVVRESGSELADKITSLFKKNAVLASASVVVQQPSAIGRALCMVDSKYFAKTTITKRDYEELKKYAPVAIIKEMGYFDTNMARNTVDWLNSESYHGFKERGKALIKDGSYRDDRLSSLASKADELTWCHIWNACKAEARDKYSGLTSEEQLQKAGEKFTDVITKTQVYDSVFSRSALMRSRNGVTKMATAFMAEPTTNLNMLVNAVIQTKRGKMTKSAGAKVLGAVMAAQILNALLETIVTAARDDDDDKTYLEKYVAQLLPNFVDDANPLNWIPYIKDVISIFKGYDITRSDMSLVTDLANFLNKLQSDTLSTGEKIQTGAGALGAFLGVPIKNILRDGKAAFNVINSAKSDMSFNETALREKFKGELKDALVTDNILSYVGIDILEEKDKRQLIYEAVLNGDDEMYHRIANNLDNPDTYIKGGLTENDIRIANAGIEYSGGDVGELIRTARELKKDGFDYELAVKTIKSYASSLKTAKGYLDEKDTESYNETLEKLLASGVDKAKVEKAIKAIEIEEESDNESKLYTGEDLYNAVEAGQQDYIDTIITANENTDIANGKSKEDAVKNVKKSLSKFYKEKYVEADDNGRKQIESKLAKTNLFDSDDYTKWVSDSYNTDKMVEVFNTGDRNQIQSYVSERVTAKVNAGMEETNAIGGIKTSITNEYRDKFINGNADTRAEIITIMTNTGIYGSRSEVIAWINKYWLK